MANEKKEERAGFINENINPGQEEYLTGLTDNIDDIGTSLEKLYYDLCLARQKRGWNTKGFTSNGDFVFNYGKDPLYGDDDIQNYSKMMSYILAEAKNGNADNNGGDKPGYKTEFPSLNLYTGSEIIANLYNQVKLVINDITPIDDNYYRSYTIGCYSGCIGECANSCSGNDCASNCFVTCGMNCGADCQNDCSADNCTHDCNTGCVESCSKDCNKDCNTICYTAECTGQCVNQGCKNECATDCDSRCSFGKCLGTCSKECAQSCRGSCDDFACIGECSSNCGTDCGGECKIFCTTSCGNACYAKCSTGSGYEGS